MSRRLLFVSLLVIASSALAADLDTVPAKPIARKKKLLFSDDFQSAERDKRWHRVVDTFIFENGFIENSTIDAKI